MKGKPAKLNVSPPGCATSRLRPATPVHYQETIGCHGNVPQRIEKLISDCSHSSISHENLAKIGEVDFEIIGPTGIVKKCFRFARATSLKKLNNRRNKRSIAVPVRKVLQPVCQKVKQPCQLKKEHEYF